MIAEDQLEQLCLSWFQEGGFEYVYGPDISPDGNAPERSDYRQVVLAGRLMDAIKRINPHLPQNALEEAAHSVTKPDHPSLIHNNRAFHRLLIDGVKIEYTPSVSLPEGERGKKTDHVQLIDFENPHNNQFLVVNQFTVLGSKMNRRPDVVVFINGLPMAVIELKIRPMKTPMCGMPIIRFRPTRKRFRR